MSMSRRWAFIGISLLLISSLAAGLFTAGLIIWITDRQDQTASGPPSLEGAPVLDAVSPAAGSVGAARGPASGQLELRGEVLEPDPGLYDREGVDRWWRTYRLRHPIGSASQ
jgi:hypothetical protein